MTPWVWRKLGVIWNAEGQFWWCQSHATCPTPLLLSDGSVRVFFSSRDRKNVGRSGYFDVSCDNLTEIQAFHPEPVLEVGQAGCFDDNGVCICSVVNEPDAPLMGYYVGFELSHHIRYRLFTGLALSQDQGRMFRRVSPAPVLDRSAEELYFRGGPFVVKDGSRYRMWYVAGSDWITVGGESKPVYDLRYAESADGIHWPESGRSCLTIEHEDEHGFGRPYVIRDGEGYRMFFSVRRKSHRAYRLGMASSPDGINWRREDELLGLDVSEDGWDSKEICYAAPIRIGDRLFVFYNGNGMGETGIGVAVLEERP